MDASTGAARNARYVAYFVSLAAGCVMGLISVYSNERRGDLGCTAHCEASVRTLRNFLGIVAAPVAGAFSDTHGRRVTLITSSVVMITSYVVWASTHSIEAFFLYNAMNGIAGLGMTFTVCKALVADGTAPEDKVETQGILGAAAGCGVIAGPVIAMLLVSSQTEAAITASVVQACVLAVLLLVPFESGTTTTGNSVNDTASSAVTATGSSHPSSESDGNSITPPPRDARVRVPLTGVLALGGLTDAALDVWDELRHATAGEVVLVTARFIISLGYHVFLTGFYDMLRDRGLLTSPRAWSMYMAFLGTLYAVTQRVAAGPLSRRPLRPAMLASIMCVAVGRWGAFALAYNEAVLYASFGLAVVGVALFNTLVNGMATRIAARNATGGLMGLLQSSEDFSGIVGPSIGSLAFELHTAGPLSVCLVLYAVLSIVMSAEWPVVVAEAEAAEAKARATAKSKAE